MTRRGPVDREGSGGFTLIEVVVAFAILSLVLLSFLGTRTDAMIDAMEARNWRLAREIAEEVLSELQAGARELPPEPSRVPIEKYENFSYQILVGEAAISEQESSQEWDVGADSEHSDRLAWQHERDDIRRAQQKGMTLQDYRDNQYKEEISLDKESQVPSETDVEDVMVVVYFPNVRPKEGDSSGEETFKLRAKVSTLAIEGLTPDEADALASSRGQTPQNAAAGSGSGSGSGTAPQGQGQ